MSSDKQRLGAKGEELAEARLVERGLTLVVRNYRCPYGEVDRIMRDGEALVFVEVKTRRNDLFGPPANAVTRFKRRQITRTALNYLQENAEMESPCRFDVVEVLLEDGAPPTIRHYPAVFDAEEWDD